MPHCSRTKDYKKLPEGQLEDLNSLFSSRFPLPAYRLPPKLLSLCQEPSHSMMSWRDGRRSPRLPPYPGECETRERGGIKGLESTFV